MLETVCNLVSVLILFWIAYLVSVTCVNVNSESERTFFLLQASFKAMCERIGKCEDALGLPNIDAQRDAEDEAILSRYKPKESVNAKSSGKTNL
jgi:hypothetical protein